jgi:hypothetical protein
MMIKPVSYLQTDRRWKGLKYAESNDDTVTLGGITSIATIGNSGCGPTCMAMEIATYCDKSVTPATTAGWSLAHGFKALKQGTFYTYFMPQGKAYGLDVRQLNGANLRGLSKATAMLSHQKAIDAVKAGKHVICCMGPISSTKKGNWTSSGHFILWYGFDASGHVLINDPNSIKPERLTADLSLLQSQVKYYFVVDVTNLHTVEVTKMLERIKKVLKINDEHTLANQLEVVKSTLTSIWYVIDQLLTKLKA